MVEKWEKTNHRTSTGLFFKRTIMQYEQNHDNEWPHQYNFVFQLLKEVNMLAKIFKIFYDFCMNIEKKKKPTKTGKNIFCKKRL